MISMFATGDFIRCDVKPPYRDAVGAVCLLMGFVAKNDGPLLAIVNGQDGQIELVDPQYLTTDFVYDASKDRFVDRSADEPPDEVTEE